MYINCKYAKLKFLQNVYILFKFASLGHYSF